MSKIAGISSCLSSCSYIKPQQYRTKVDKVFVVYHLVPTSNHNWCYVSLFFSVVVYHLVPTSNHNLFRLLSNAIKLFIILFLHQTTTRIFIRSLTIRCLSSCSYIKPQLLFVLLTVQLRCLSSCSYIKPQLWWLATPWGFGCLSSCSYIKPQLIHRDDHISRRCLSSCSYIKPQLASWNGL